MEGNQFDLTNIVGVTLHEAQSAGEDIFTIVLFEFTN